MPDRLKQVLEQAQQTDGAQTWIGATIATLGVWGVALRHFWRHRSGIRRLEMAMAELKTSVDLLSEVVGDTNQRVSNMEGRFAERDYTAGYAGPDWRRRD
jgi:hypothetical protein